MIDVIIVNWNAGSQLVEAVSSIAQYHHGLVATVVIVDNASTDDSLKLVEKLQNLPFQIQIIHNSENKGFGAACNQGATLVKSEFILFLNPDTRLFENSLPVPIAFIQDKKNQDVGVVGIQLVDEHNKITRSCARFPTLGLFVAQILGINRLPRLQHLNIQMTDWTHDKTATVDHVIGAFYLMKRSLFDALEGFDEHFFVYFEDLDLSLRAYQAGYRNVYLTEAIAFHAGGGTSRQIKARRLFYSLRSRLFYGIKHFSSWQVWILMVITMSIEPVSRILYSLTKGVRCSEDVANTWRAYTMLWSDFKHILEKSR